MYKTAVTYTDYNGDVRTEELYFNLNEPEFIRFDVRYPGGLTNFIPTLGVQMGKDGKAEFTPDADTNALFTFFEDLIKASYGVKSDDGKRFVKNEGEVGREFMETAAYASFFRQITSDSDSAAAFVNGVLSVMSIRGETPKTQN